MTAFFTANPFRFSTFFLLWGLALLLSVPAFSQRKVLTGPKPAWVKSMAPARSSSIQADEVSDGYSILLRDYQHHFEQQTEYYHMVRKIYSESGVQNGSEIEYTFDPSYQKLIF